MPELLWRMRPRRRGGDGNRLQPAMFPGLLILLTVLAYNSLGDDSRDALSSSSPSVFHVVASARRWRRSQAGYALSAGSGPASEPPWGARTREETC